MTLADRLRLSLILGVLDRERPAMSAQEHAAVEGLRASLEPEKEKPDARTASRR